LPIVNGRSLRDYLISYHLTNTLISEVFLHDTNMPDGLPDLTGVVVREVGGDFVRFGQVGSPGSSDIIVAIDRIQVVEVA
jgi:hypothetical protein